MGNAVDNDHLLLQPYQLLELMPLLAGLYRASEERGLLMIVGNNIGYFGPYEHIWRGFGDDRVHWTGCAAGQTVLALEADGTVKGCPSLATIGFAGGNVRDLTLEEIWRSSKEIHFGRMRSVDDLWGFCRSCYYADVCRGGCTWTSHSLLGTPGNNPFCHHRALELQKQGLRERVIKVRDAAPGSFAIGEFELITERTADGQVVATSTKTPRPARSTSAPSPDTGHITPQLGLCRACNAYVAGSEITCPHCGADIQAVAEAYEEDHLRRSRAIADMERQLATIQPG